MSGPNIVPATVSLQAPVLSGGELLPPAAKQRESVKPSLQLEDLSPGLTSSLFHLKEEDYSKVVHVKGNDHSTGRRIMVCDHASPEGPIALDYALKSLITKDDHVFLVTVLPLEMVDAAFMGLIPDHMQMLGPDVRMLKTMGINAMKLLRAKAQKIVEMGTNAVTIHIVHGKATHSLVALGDYHNVDLIVMGRRKLGLMEKMTGAGSVSDFVIDHADQAVVVVKE